MTKIFIGIDNGPSGSIGIITPENVIFFETPIIVQQDYTKKKANTSRIDWTSLLNIFNKYDPNECFVLMERPMVNPTRFKATKSALRALESTLILMEHLKMPYSYLDSKEWQRVLLPQGIKGSDELKNASIDIGCRLFPQFTDLIKKHKDADGILIAEYCRRIK